MMKDSEHYPIFIAEKEDDKNPNQKINLRVATQIMFLVMQT